MQVNRFWGSVWSVVAYLFAVALLLYIAQSVATLFGLLPAAWARPVLEVVGLVIPIIGTIGYLDWRWSWRPEHVGLARRFDSAVWILAGLGLGAVAGLVTLLLTRLLPGGEGVPGLQVATFPVWTLVQLLFLAFITELVFRGAVISRYQADLTHREVLIASTLTPFGWQILQSFFRLGDLPVGTSTAWMAAMSVALTLLFLRTDSVWLSTGIRFGTMASLLITGAGNRQVETGGLLLWGAIAVILLAMEWNKLQGQPKRIEPRGQNRWGRGRTVRGPWGPH